MVIKVMTFDNNNDNDINNSNNDCNNNGDCVSGQSSVLGDSFLEFSAMFFNVSKKKKKTYGFSTLVSCFIPIKVMSS